MTEREREPHRSTSDADTAPKEPEASSAETRPALPAARVDHETPRRDLLARLLPSLSPGAAGSRARGRSDSPPTMPRIEPVPAAADFSDEPETARSDLSALAAAARTGSGALISTILGRSQPSAAGDEGALAALRTLPRRAACDPDYADPIGRGERESQRLRLLSELAGASQGRAKARLLTQAAELATRAGDGERALGLYADAIAADPSHAVAAVQLRRHRLRRGELQAALELLRTEAAHSQVALERSLALCAVAELEARVGAPREQRIATLKAAVQEGRGSLLAPLLLAREQREAGAPAELAAALKACAEGVSDGAVRALCALEAGRALERAAQNDSALASHEAASGSDRGALGPLLGIVRLRNARSDRQGAALNLAKLCGVTGDARLQAEWTRQRALVLLDGAGEAAEAMVALQGADTPQALRTLARAAEAAGEKAEQRRALAAWARGSGGMLQSLAVNELGFLRGTGAFTLSSRPPRDSVPADAEAISGSDALHAAAELIDDPERAARERELLSQVRSRDRDPWKLSCELLAFDAAAEQGDMPQLSAALVRDATRWPEAMRIGPLFAALDLPAGDAEAAQHNQLLLQLAQLAHAQPVVTRYLAARASSAEQSAKLWLLEAVAANGDHAAFAATMAGRFFEIARLDPTEAYGDALDAERGYLPAALGLEIAARVRGDLSALERAEREVAHSTPSKLERCARQVRLGLLNADSDLSAAAHWLEEAAADTTGDAVLDELSIRLSMDQSPAHRAELLERAASRQGSPAFARALKLQAASAYEEAQHWDAAQRLYEQLLAQNPEDVFVDCAMLSLLRRAGRSAALANELERRVLLSTSPEQRVYMLEEWAQVEQDRGDPKRRRGVLQSVLDQSPRHVPALRALQRYAMQEHDDALLAEVSLELSAALEEPTARAAELRLGVRALARRGADAAQPLLAAEGRVRELWYAQQLEALALRSGDRARLYEALRMLSDLSRERDPIERAAHALRAAEVLESAAPARAVRELGEALLAAREHPLAIEQLARLHKAAGDALAAAHAFERAAGLTSDPRRSATLHYSAGVLFQDELGDPERALENLAWTARTDVLFADTFARLSQLLLASGRKQERRALIESRLRAPIEPSLAAELEWERFELCRDLDDWSEAKRALLAVLEFDPEHADALSALADVYLRLGAYHDAAEILVRLARVTDSEAALAEVFLRLGVLYDEQLPHAERAELALSRAVTLAPDDIRALERLAGVYERQSRHGEALDLFQHLLHLAPNQAARERYTVRRAALLDHMGQRREAAEALEEARAAAPTSLPILRAQRALLERAGDRAALATHLERACDALRAAIEHAPGELDHWLGLCELLKARDRDDGLQLVAAAAQALGLKHDQFKRLAPRGLGQDALRPAVVERLTPRGQLEALRALLSEFGRELEPFLPFDESEEPAQLELAPRVVDGVSALFSVPTLRLVQCAKPLCLPLTAAPLTVCVGGELFHQASDAERFFLLARAVAVAGFDWSLLVRSAPERVGLVLNALRQVVEPAHTVAVLDAHEQALVARELAQRVAPAARPRVQALLHELIEHEELAPRRLSAAALDFGSRVALTVTGNMPAALSALLRMRGKPPESYELADRLELCSTEPAIRGLLSFAISETYMDARQQAWVAAAQETG